MSFEEEVTTQIGLPESNRLKYEPLLPSSSELGRVICAFCNTDGGTIILGVLNKNNKINIIGLSADFQVNVVLINAISKLSPSPIVRHASIEHNEKRLFIIKVEKANQVVSYNQKIFGIKSKKIYQINSTNDTSANQSTMSTEIYLDAVLEYLVNNPGLINVNKHTVRETILNSKISVSEAEQLISKLRNSGYVKSYGDRYIGVSIDTKPFLNGGGFSKTNVNLTKTIDNKKIFISYNWEHKISANKLFEFLKAEGYLPTIDGHTLEYKDSISTFMESIRTSDFVILMISDDYLKSENCMIEVMHVLKDRNSHDKILPIRHEEVNIFKSSDRIKYVEYWRSRVEELEMLLKSVNPTTAIEEFKNLKITKRIYEDIGDFLSDISDMITSTIEEEEEASYKNIVNYIKANS